MDAVPTTSSIPAPLARLYAKFPLYEVPASQGTTPPPVRPTLWAYGPPPAGHRESLDPLCRAAQAFARFSLADGAADVRWMDWQGQEGAPGGTLPALHTPEGDLVVGDEVSAWVAAQGAAPLPAKGKKGSADAPAPSDPSHQAFLALVLSTLLPALLSSLYLSPPSLVPPVVPSRQRPVLAAVAHRYLSWNDRATRIDQIKRLRGGKLGKAAVLDLEEVEREARDTIEALEVKLGDEDPNGWFGGASSPTRLDALVYALLSIASVLPPSCDKVLRPTLERCPRLLAWVKAHGP
ncbi:uncharacterized protein RHOBADRAFT_42840 [Rhodotorula graminis WP1]|uniref:Metaxin glutathione S-transferase domain-containing protein n=1 Tax=Rhodotorula graminis (strain WP1) TaxID=578459 RepID=A0A194S7H3_RHOGW|nr:uncharacterized protein RHOBADRAFT_42840 [Rhodotorula graminis WP1]KPV76499.1 hypothetical protein RHOBADRAFT_42840 [Rhodotorula graminis WP1]